jgi:hypothetical protein
LNSSFNAIENPFRKTDKILGAGTYIGLSVFFNLQSAIVSVVEMIFLKNI